MSYYQPMEPSQRDHWKQIAFGRDSTAEARDHAMSMLAASAPSSPVHRAATEAAGGVPSNPPRRPRWLARALIIGIVAVVGGVAVAVLLPKQSPPLADSRPLALAPALAADVPGNREDENILDDPDQADIAERLAALFAPEVLVAAIPLGQTDRGDAYGVLTEGQNVCIYMRHGDTGTAKCSPLAEFRSDGIGIDRGSWGVVWNPDGSASWSND